MKQLLLVTALFFAGSSFGQTIPNAGFETWAASGPFNAPTSWAVSPGVRQSNQAHSGSWAIQCTVDTFTNPFSSTLDTVAGLAYSGAMVMGPPTPGANLPGYAFTSRPDSLTGFYKYHAMGPDTCNVTVLLSKWNSASGTRTPIAEGRFNSATNDSVYRRFSTNLVYSDTATPDTCVIVINSANNGPGPKHMGTSVWVDDLAFANRNTTSIGALIANNNFSVYPNPVGNTLTISEAGNFKVERMMLMNMLGQVVLQTNSKTLNTAEVANGSYILQVVGIDGSVTSQQVVKR